MILATDFILPITDKKEIGSGGSAILYKITVDEVFNKLKPADPTRAVSQAPMRPPLSIANYSSSWAKA